jgi:hypothetical protein
MTLVVAVGVWGHNTLLRAGIWGGGGETVVSHIALKEQC